MWVVTFRPYLYLESEASIACKHVVGLLVPVRSAIWETSTDELPVENEETYGEAIDPAYAYARAEANFRRFSNGLHTIMAVRLINLPENADEMKAPSTDRSTVVPEHAHKKMDAPSQYEVGSGIYVNPSETQ